MEDFIKMAAFVTSSISFSRAWQQRHPACATKELRFSIGRFSGPRSNVRHRLKQCWSMSVEAPVESKLKSFLKEAGDLGTIRFLAVTGGGAVLETIGRFDYPMQEFSIPGKGRYLTIKSEDGVFACNINADTVARVKMSKESAKQGNADIYVMRLLDEKDGIVLSCLLMWNPAEGPGHYLAGAVDAFEKLKSKYGEVFDL